MNTVAPPFVSRDNILSFSSVQWTVSWICLTPRISISVNTRDNLDNCHQATRNSMNRKKRMCTLCSTVWLYWNIVAVLNLPGVSGSLFWNVKTYLAVHIDILAFTHTFIHTKTDFCLLWIGRQPGFLNGIDPNEYVNEIRLMHLGLFDLGRTLYIQYNSVVCWFPMRF